MSAEPAADTGPGDGLQERVEQFRALRAQLERMILPLAHSLDGRRFEWQAPRHEPSLTVGGYVMLRSPDGNSRLGQILDARLVEEAAGELGVAADGSGSTLRSTVSLRLVRGHGAVLHGAAGPFSDAALQAAAADEIADYRAQVGARSAPLPIGSLAAAPEVPASIDARGFGRHTFLCGQSGSGKTYSLGVVLDRLLAATSLRIVILDPNSDFTALGRVREGVAAEAAERHREVAAGIRVRSAGTGPGRLHVPFPALSDEDRAALLRLDPIADREEYAELLDLLGEQRPASWDDLDGDGGGSERRLTQRVKNLKLHTLGIWSRGDPDSILDDLERDDVRCLVVDLGSLPTRTESALAAEAVLATLWRRREERRPVLVVIDEAHNVCPAQAEDAVTARATEHVVRIAAEGRKFGLHLLLCTQRPQKLPENAVTQCDNLILMRLNARADLAFIEDAFSFVPSGLIGLASGFGLGEALVAGKIAPDPLLMRFGQRVSEEGGGDVPATWASR
jgi:hypothetical protein